MSKVVLFDIDGTLTKSGSTAHNRAFQTALQKTYGVKNVDIGVVDHPGMTDWQIIHEVLKWHGLGDAEIDEKVQQAMKEMVRAFKKFIKEEKLAVLPGVRKLLALLETQGMRLGLITGNLESIAYGKLKNVGLDRYFKFGGFGNYSKSRPELVRHALERARQFGFSKNDAAFLLGDTPRDIAAGQEAGVKTIGVATGKHSESELKQAGADYVLKDLTDQEKLLKIIL